MPLSGFLKFRDRSAPQKADRSAEPELLQGDEEEDLRSYIETFVENGLKLQDEQMVNHEAIAAARCEYLAEFYRKRQLSR